MSGQGDREMEGTVLGGLGYEDTQGTVLGGLGYEDTQGTVLGGLGYEDTQGTVLGGLGYEDTQGTVLGGLGYEDTQGTVLGGLGYEDTQGTVLGSQSQEDRQDTVLGKQSISGKKWNAELLLRPYMYVGGYEIIEFISQSGEAEVYLGIKDEKRYAVKVYRQSLSLKEDVVERLQGVEFKNLAYMTEVGTTKIEIRAGEFVEKHYEVSPFYKQIQKPMPYDELRNLIAQVNEGLNELHNIHIFHKDIKPANIMQDEEGIYRIIDFGISSVAQEGQTHINNTKTGISFDYASPDARFTFKAGPAEDYYSLGISIYEMFTGELPYKELGEANNRYEQLIAVGIQFRESQNVPKELVKLIHGLTFYSNHAELKKKRWGYEEVRKWLTQSETMEDLDMKEHSGMGNGYGSDARATRKYPKAYSYQSRLMNDSYTLADALGSSWTAAKSQVGRGSLTEYFKKLGFEYATEENACEEVQEILDNEKKRDAASKSRSNRAFWNLLYSIEPKLEKFYWYVPKSGEQTDYTCEEAGAYLFLNPLLKQAQQKKNMQVPDDIHDLIQSGVIPVYLRKQLKDEVRAERAERFIQEYHGQNDRNSIKAAWKLGYLLYGRAVFQYQDLSYETRQAFYEDWIRLTNAESRKEALARSMAFQITEEFEAWAEYQEGN